MTLADIGGVSRRTTASQAGHGTEAVTERHYLDRTVDDHALREFSAVHTELWVERESRGVQRHE